MEEFGDDDAPFEGFGDDTPFEGFGNEVAPEEVNEELCGKEEHGADRVEEPVVTETTQKVPSPAKKKDLVDKSDKERRKPKTPKASAAVADSPAVGESSHDEKRGRKRGRTDPSMGGPTYQEGLFAPPSEPRRKGSNMQFLLALQKRSQKKRSDNSRLDSETSEGERSYSKATPGRSDSDEPASKKRRGRPSKADPTESPEIKGPVVDSDSDNLVINEDRKKRKSKKKSKRRIDSEKEESVVQEPKASAGEQEETIAEEQTEQEHVEATIDARFDSPSDSAGEQEIRDSVSMAMQMLGSDDETETLLEPRGGDAQGESEAERDDLEREPAALDEQVNESVSDVPAPIEEETGEPAEAATTAAGELTAAEPTIKRAKGRKSFPRRKSTGPSSTTADESPAPAPEVEVKTEPAEIASTPVPAAEAVENVLPEPSQALSSTPAGVLESSESASVRKKRIKKLLSTPSTPSTPVPSPKHGRRTVKTDVNNPEFLKPFDYGFRRELVHRATGGTSDVYYFPPVGKKLRSNNEIADYLSQNNYPLTVANFTFYKGLVSGDPKFEVSRGAAIGPRLKNFSSPIGSPATPIEETSATPSDVLKSAKGRRKLSGVSSLASTSETPSGVLKETPATPSGVLKSGKGGRKLSGFSPLGSTSAETPSGGLKVKLGRRPKTVSGLAQSDRVIDSVASPPTKQEVAAELPSVESKNGEGREGERSRVPPLILKKKNANQLWAHKPVEEQKPTILRVYSKPATPNRKVASSGLKFILQDMMKEAGAVSGNLPEPEESAPPAALQEPLEQPAPVTETQVPAEPEDHTAKSPEKAPSESVTLEEAPDLTSAEKAGESVTPAAESVTPAVEAVTPSVQPPAASEAAPAVRKTISVRNASYLFPSTPREKRSVRPPTRFLDTAGGKPEPSRLQPLPVVSQQKPDSGVSPVKTPGVAPCTVLCSKARGQFPNLSCAKCLCLFHGVCLGFSPLYSPKPGVSFICPSCTAQVDEGEVEEVGQHIVQHLSPADILGHADTHVKPTVMRLKFDGNKFAVTKSATYSQPPVKKVMAIRPAIRYIGRLPSESRTTAGNTEATANLASPPPINNMVPQSTAPLVSAPSAAPAHAQFVVKSVRNISVQTEVEEAPPPKPPTPPPPAPLPVVGCQTIEHIRDRQNRLRRFIVISNIPVSEERPCPFAPVPERLEPTPEVARVPEEPMEIAPAITTETSKEPTAVVAKEIPPSPWSSDFANTLTYAYKGLLHVFSYLTAVDKGRAASVCKLWQKLANEPSLWGHVDTRKLKLKSLRNFFNRIRKLEIASVDLRGIERKQRESLFKYLNIPDVKTIVMCPCLGQVIELLLRTCGDLVELVADKVEGTHLNFQDVKTHFRLEKLVLEFVEEVEVSNLAELQKLHKMKELSLLGVGNIIDLKFLELMPRLQVLRLGSLTNLDEQRMKISTTFRNVKNLNTLRLENGPEWDSELSLLNSFGSLEQLTHLELLRFRSETNLLSTLSLVPNLEQFLFMPITSIDTSEVIFGDLLDHLPELRHLRKFCLLLLDDCLLFDGTIVVRRETIERLNALKPQPKLVDEAMEVDVAENPPYDVGGIQREENEPKDATDVEQGPDHVEEAVASESAEEAVREAERGGDNTDDVQAENEGAEISNVIDDPRIWASLENAQLSTAAIEAIENARHRDQPAESVVSQAEYLEETPAAVETPTVGPNVLQNVLDETLYVEEEPPGYNYEEALSGAEEHTEQPQYETDVAEVAAPAEGSAPYDEGEVQENEESDQVQFASGCGEELDNRQQEQSESDAEKQVQEEVAPEVSATASHDDSEAMQASAAVQKEPSKAMPSIFDLDDEVSAEAAVDVGKESEIEADIPVAEHTTDYNQTSEAEKDVDDKENMDVSQEGMPLLDDNQEDIGVTEAGVTSVNPQNEENLGTALPSLDEEDAESTAEVDESMDVDFAEAAGSVRLSQSSLGETDTQSPIKGAPSYIGEGDHPLSESSRDNADTRSPEKAASSPRGEVTFKIGASETSSSIFDETSKSDSIKGAVNNAVTSLFDIESQDEPAPSNVDFHRSEESIAASEPASEVSSFHEPQDENAHMGPPTPLQPREESSEAGQQYVERPEMGLRRDYEMAVVENGINHSEENEKPRSFISKYSVRTADKEYTSEATVDNVFSDPPALVGNLPVDPTSKDTNVPCTVTPEELYEYFKLALPSVEVCVIRANEENVRLFSLDSIDWENNMVIFQ